MHSAALEVASTFSLPHECFVDSASGLTEAFVRSSEPLFKFIRPAVRKFRMIRTRSDRDCSNATFYMKVDRSFYELNVGRDNSSSAIRITITNA